MKLITKMTLFILIVLIGFLAVDLDSEECSLSEYNTYTNITGGMRLLGNCYVPTNNVITKTEKCGTFGFVCRDVEPYQENFNSGVCFKLKNGEFC